MIVVCLLLGVGGFVDIYFGCLWLVLFYFNWIGLFSLCW